MSNTTTAQADAAIMDSIIGLSYLTADAVYRATKATLEGGKVVHQDLKTLSLKTAVHAAMPFYSDETRATFEAVSNAVADHLGIERAPIAEMRTIGVRVQADVLAGRGR